MYIGRQEVKADTIRLHNRVSTSFKYLNIYEILTIS